MANLLRDVEELDYLIRQLQKIESKLIVGHFIPAYRGICQLLDYSTKAKQDLIKNNSGEDDA